MSHLAELAEVSVRTIHFHVEKDGSKSLGARASGNAFAVMFEAMRTGSGRKTLSIDMVNSWLIPTSNKGQVRFSQSVRSTPRRLGGSAQIVRRISVKKSYKRLTAVRKKC